MTTLTLQPSPEQYERLRAEAKRLGKPEEELARDWLAERITPLMSERGRATEVLRAARSKATLEEAQATLDRARGKPLSEVILEMRGPKE
ncbi:MAG: hypothetical protein ACR2JR_09565 [Rubrobacteraceae bacterium]